MEAFCANLLTTIEIPADTRKAPNREWGAGCISNAGN